MTKLEASIEAQDALAAAKNAGVKDYALRIWSRAFYMDLERTPEFMAEAHLRRLQGRLNSEISIARTR